MVRETGGYRVDGVLKEATLEECRDLESVYSVASMKESDKKSASEVEGFCKCSARV